MMVEALLPLKLLYIELPSSALFIAYDEFSADLGLDS
jgi:hypothetical protein